MIRDHADTIYHPVGSCRMGHGDMDVVDAQLRVHGILGLRVRQALSFSAVDFFSSSVCGSPCAASAF